MKYFVLQIKRAFKLFPYVLIAAVILLAGLFAALHFVGDTTKQNDSIRFKLGIVGSSDDDYLMTGLKIVQTDDSSRFAVDTVQMDEQQAIEALKSGELGAYVVIPDGYIRDAMGGKLGSLKYVSTTGAADLTTLFKYEATAVVSDIIIACERSMYGVEDALASKKLDDRAGQYIYDISMCYVDYILNREDMYSVQELGIHDALGMDGYLFSGISVLILSLLMTPVCSIVIKSDYSFERHLKSKNIGVIGQITGEFGAIYCIYLLLFLIIGAVITIFCSYFSSDVIRYVSVFSLKHTYVLVSVLFELSTMSYLLLSLAKNTVSGVLVHFAAIMICCFCAGCMYPLSFFPDFLQRIAKLFPQYFCREAIAAIITNDPCNLQIILLLVFGCLMIALSMLLRTHRLQKGQG